MLLGNHLLLYTFTVEAPSYTTITSTFLIVLVNVGWFAVKTTRVYVGSVLPPPSETRYLPPAAQRTAVAPLTDPLTSIRTTSCCKPASPL